MTVNKSFDAMYADAPGSLLTGFGRWFTRTFSKRRELVNDEHTALIWFAANAKTFASNPKDHWKGTLSRQCKNNCENVPGTVDGVEVRSILMNLYRDPSFGISGILDYRVPAGDPDFAS